MKILIIMKRFSSGKDCVGEHFGRQFRLGEQLAKNHHVDYLVADYTKKEQFTKKFDQQTCLVRPFSPLFFFDFYRYAKKKAKQYDAIIGASDPLFQFLALCIAPKKFIIYDMQDNYESYAIGKLPFFSTIERWMVKKSNLTLVESYLLEKKFKKYAQDMLIIPNGITPSINKPQPKQKVTKQFNLPSNKKIIYYSGRYESNHQTQGFNQLVRVLTQIAKTNDSIHLFAVGDGNKHHCKHLLKKGCATAIDSVSYEEYVASLSTADVFVLPYTRGAYTKYMLTPYKLPEYMVYNKPIVCSDVGEYGSLLKAGKQFMYNPDHDQELKEKILQALKTSKTNYSPALKELSWEVLGKKIHRKLPT